MKTLLFGGDFHPGAFDSLMPPQVVIEPWGKSKHVRPVISGHRPHQSKKDAVTINANKDQKWLFKCWKTMAEEVGNVDLFVLNGDMIDGTGPKDRGAGMWTTNVRVQADTMVSMAKMVKAKKYAGTLGSFYHIGDNMSADEYVIDKLHGMFGVSLKIKIEDLAFNISHEVGYSKNWNGRYTALGGELQASFLNNKSYYPYDVIVRSHVHYHVLQTMSDGENTKTAFTTPCWRLRDTFAEKKGLTMTPHIGYVLVKVDGDRLSVTPRLFVRPKEDREEFDMVIT